MKTYKRSTPVLRQTRECLGFAAHIYAAIVSRIDPFLKAASQIRCTWQSGEVRLKKGMVNEDPVDRFYATPLELQSPALKETARTISRSTTQTLNIVRQKYGTLPLGRRNLNALLCDTKSLMIAD